jgi:hypothetical protein
MQQPMLNIVPNGMKVKPVGIGRLTAVMAKISFKCGIAVFTGSCHTMLLKE